MYMYASILRQRKFKTVYQCKECAGKNQEPGLVFNDSWLGDIRLFMCALYLGNVHHQSNL